MRISRAATPPKKYDGGLYTDLNKNDYRKKILEKISSFDEEYIINSNREIFNTLVSLPDIISAKTVFTYYSIGREVDTKRFIDFCFSMGKRVALPVINCEAMVFAVFGGDPKELDAGVYGIPTPSLYAQRIYPERGDVVIVPGLCYNENGYRLGRGGGYYDGFLADCRAKAIGVCREELVCPDVPVEPHDIPVALLVTENKNRGH